MEKIRSHIRVALALVALVSSGAVFAARPGGTWVNNTYYTDASYSVVAGTRNYDCQGRLSTTGSPTAYQSFVDGQCAGSSPLPPASPDPAPAPPIPKTCWVSVIPGTNYHEILCDY